MYRLCVVLCLGVAGLLVAALPAPPSVIHRIVGGVNATVKDHPYMVSLQYWNYHRCGAAIISQRWVLSAGHCVVEDDNPERLPIQYLDVRVGTDTHSKGGLIHKVEDFFMRSEFDFDTLDYDISVVKLQTSIEYTLVTQAIMLTRQDERLQDGQLLNVTGWGWIKDGGPLGNPLQRVEVPYIESDRCQQYLLEPPFDQNITERMICAGYPEGQRDACNGDSGGPMTTKEGILVGIVSWGFGCALPKMPGGYTRVAYFRNWIDDIIKKNSLL